MYMVLGQLQMDEHGNRYEYRWVEEFGDTENYPEELRIYRVTQENTDKGLTFVTVLTNVHVPEKVKVPVVKIWDDQDDQDGVRPASVTIQLMKQVGTGTPTEAARFTLTKEDKEVNGMAWSHVFDNLPKYEGGEEITYSVREAYVAGYTMEEPPQQTVFTIGTETLNGFTVTNKHEIQKTNVSVTKVWDDGDDLMGMRPTGIRVVLTRNNVPVTLNTDEYVKIPTNELTPEDLASGAYTTTSVTIDSVKYDVKYKWDSIAKRYVVTVEGLPRYKDGSEILYGWREDSLTSGYSMSDIRTEGTLTTITNRYDAARFCLTITKVWDDDNDRDGIRPGSVTMQLMANGEPATYADGTAVELIVLTKENNWTGMVLGVPIYRNYVPITYMWREVNVATGYTVSTPMVSAGVYTDLIDANTATTRVATITNTHKPDLTASATVRKIWADNNDEAGMRPKSVTLTLYGNGKEVTKVVLDESNNWMAYVGNLPASEGGKPIVYTWREQEVLSYAPTESVEGSVTTITNTYRTHDWNIINNYNTTNVTNNNNTTNNNNYTRGGEVITRTVTVGGGGNVVNGGGLVINNQANFEPNMPGEPLIEIEDYGTPLGINVIINHVGDCFD